MQLYLLDGARLRQLREEAGLSQEELSAMVGQRKGWVRELEPGSVAQAEDTGEEVYASVETIWNLARALEVSPTVLLKH